MYPCKFPCGQLLHSKCPELSISHEGQSFSFKVGDLPIQGNPDSDQSKYRVVLYHKKTGEVLQYNTHFISFRPVIEKLQAGPTNENVGVTYSDLTRELGSAIAKRALNETEKNQVSQDTKDAIRSIQQEVLKEEKSIKRAKLEETTFTMAFSIDEIMKSEKKVKLSLIVNNDILISLEEDSQNVSQNTLSVVKQEVDNQKYCPSIVDLIWFVNKENMKEMQLCLFLNYLIKFYSLPIKKIRHRVPIEGCPEEVIQFILKCYTRKVSSENSKPIIQFPKDEKENLLLVIVALYGYLRHEKFSVTHLQQDMKIGTEKMRKTVQTLGGKVVQELQRDDKNGSHKECVACWTGAYIIDDI